MEITTQVIMFVIIIKIIITVACIHISFTQQILEAEREVN